MSEMDEQQRRGLEAAFAAASRSLNNQASAGMGQLSTRRAAEARYSQAYQALVKAGFAPQLRKKYR